MPFVISHPQEAEAPSPALTLDKNRSFYDTKFGPIMKIREDIRSVTYLKSRAADLLEQINGTQRPVVITQKGEARGVLLDPDSYERMRTAIGLLKLLAQGEKDIHLGRVAEQASVFARLERRLKAKKRDGTD